MTTTALVPEIHVADKGTVFLATLYEDGLPANISAATTKEFVFQSPAGVKTTVTAQFVDLGATGQLTYTTLGTEFTVAGNWRWQVHLITPTGEWRTSITNFTVLENL